MEEFLFLCISYLVVCYSVDLQESVKYVDVLDTECHGTSVGFGYSASLRSHYEFLKKRYQGCTFVHGNLEVTNLYDPRINYDLSFLSKIRYVSGYVLIGLVSELDEIKFQNLEVIRGNRTYRVRGGEYSLVVALTSRYSSPHLGLQELHMPALREIVDGKVLFLQNPVLCYVDTIPWHKLTKGRNTSGLYRSVHFGDKAFSQDCPKCPIECSFTDMSSCWGSSSSLCSLYIENGCHESCNGLCFTGGAGGCCDERCAVGCTGPSEFDCQVCRDFKMGEKCVTYCPDMTYTYSQNCILF